MKFVIAILVLVIGSVALADDKRELLYEVLDGSKSIKFKFNETFLDGYKVEGEWTPNGEEAALSGPSIIKFYKDDTQEKFQVFIALSSMNFSHFDGLNLTLDDGETFNASVDLDKTYSLNYSDFYPMSLWRTHADITDNEDFYDNEPPFFFEDLDFDGIDELITVEIRAGQRWSNEYIVHKRRVNNRGIIEYKPFWHTEHNIDDLTKFDKNNRLLTFMGSGGACWNSYDIYKFEKVKYNHIASETERDVIVNPGQEDAFLACENSVFDIVDGKKVLRESIYSYWDDKSHSRKTLKPEVIRDIQRTL